MPGNRNSGSGGDDRRRFWDQVRHDLRQPVQSLQLLVQIFARHAGSEPAREGAEHMRRVVDDLAGMHEALVRIAQLEAGARPERRPLALSEVARSVLREIEGHGGEHNVDLRLTDPSISLEADEAWLTPMLRDLLLFALGQSEDGAVSMSGDRHGDSVVISVAFAAPAIPDRQADKAFIEATASGEDTGPGRLAMGPGYLRHLCDLLGYRLELESGEQGGQRFRMTVPATPAAS